MPSVVPFTCCLIIVFTTFIGEGNGKWKSKNRERLQKDIAKFQEMAEKIEEEIEDIYDEYSDNRTNDEYFSNEEESIESGKPYETKTDEKRPSIINLIRNSTNITERYTAATHKGVFNENFTSRIENVRKMNSPENVNTVSSKWPKFEDILLDMGKKYDWKNDRWIKMKKKINQSSDENHLNFHEKHKFSYKTVKLNRSKSRRNVVIAVTAVR